MKIPDKKHFQPSSDALNYYLATRKKIKTLAGKDIMPLFTDTDFENDKKWFYIALWLEFLGLFATIYGGLRSGGVTAIIAIIVVIAFMFIDFVWIAPQLHKNVGVNNYRKAKIQVLNRKKNIQQIRTLEDEIKKGKGYYYFLVFLLILMAFVKTIGIVLLGAFNSMIIYIAFFALFLIIVYAHVYKTRYYLAYKKTEKQIETDYNIFKDEQGYKVESYSKTFSTKELLRNIPVNINSHSLVKAEEEEEEENTYILRVNGVLEDDELFRLCSNQDNTNSIIIFKVGRNIQLENYGLGDNNSRSRRGSDLDEVDEVRQDDDLNEEL
ncbi:hypothetical protein [Lutibacter sp.]